MSDKRKATDAHGSATGSRKQDLTLCLIFILIGMGGVLFSTRWDDPVLHRITLLLSVALPVFGVGNFLARLHVTGLLKLLLIAGVLMLIVGGMTTVAGFPGTFASDEVPLYMRVFARWVGALGLLAGLVAILFAVVRSEEELTEIGDRFRYLTEHMSEGFTLSAPDGTIFLANRRFLEMTGLGSDEVVGRNAQEMLHDLEQESLLEHIEQNKQRRVSEFVINHRVRGQERHFAVSGTPIFNRRGQHAGTVAIFRDVTEQVELSRSLEKYAAGLQRLVEEQTRQLRDSEERLRGLLIHMNEGFLTLDGAFRVRFANERICEMLGLEPGELVGRDVFEFVDPAGRAKLLNLLEVAESKQPRRLQQETALVSPSRGGLPVVLGVSRVEDSREGGARYSLVVTDVSKQKEMQRQLEVRAIQLESANEELRILDRTKDSFLTNVTHELRTPLSTIRGYVEMLDSQCIGTLENEQRNALEVISRNLERLGTLIEEMIEFSRMQIRGFRLRISLFDLPKLAEECVRSIRPTAMQRGLNLVFSPPGGLPLVWGDRARLAQVLTNLLSNAVKFTEAGGKVEVNLSRAPGGTALLSVADTGIGIEQEFQKRVFDKFFQVDNSLERRYEGAGIGLSIAKSIAEAHGGDIELFSVPGEGSRFTLVLPEVFFDDGYTPGENARFDGKRIVCVSDDSSLREKLAVLLTQWGARVEGIAGGHEAVRACRENPPDLILSDENTSDVAGTAFITVLHNAFGEKAAPVVLLKGKNAPEEEGFIDLSGTVETLEKPFQPHEFFWKVHRMLSDPQAVLALSEARPPAPRDLDGEIAHAVIIPDEDLLEWMHVALANRKIAATYFDDPDEALAQLEIRGARALLFDMDGLTPEQSTRLAHWVHETRTPLCAITGLPESNPPRHEADAILTKPFSIQDVLDALSELDAAFPAANGVAENSRDRAP